MHLPTPRCAAVIALFCAVLAACGGGDGGSGGNDATPTATPTQTAVVADNSEAARANEPQPTPNAQMQAVLAEFVALQPQGATGVPTVEQARMLPTPTDAVRSLLNKLGRSTAPEPVGAVRDISFPGPAGELPVRVYTPAGAGAGALPLLLYIHGGGWVLDSIDTYDALARALANAAGALVLSVEYRHAPEARFPAAHDDTFAAWQWMLAHAQELGGDARRAAVAGDSAGGNMAASIAIRTRDLGLQQPIHQVLIYPATDFGFDKPSAIQNRNALPLSTAALAWLEDKYLNLPDDAANPLFSVLRVPSAAGLAPATVVTADIDPLRSEGRFYAEKLQAAGVAVDYLNVVGVTHEFMVMGAVLDEARTTAARIGANLRAAYAAML